MSGPNRSVSGTATTADVADDGLLYSVGLAGIGDAARITVRTGGASGTVLCVLAAAAANTSVQRTFQGGVPFTDLHVTVDAGTTPRWDVEV